jgi:hypothetical protein
MKVTGLIAVMAALAGASCSKPVATTGDEDAPPPPAAVTTSAPVTPIAAPAPGGAISQTPSATPAPELAPEGVFYLVAVARVENADGVHNLPPGTGVKLVRPGVYLTPYGEHPLAAALLTNDLAKARAARDADRAAQDAARQKTADVAQAARAAQLARDSATPSPIAPAMQLPAGPTPRFVEGVNRQPTGLDSSTSLGAAHTKVDDGWVWEKSADGKWWMAVKRTDGTVPYVKLQKRPVK